MTSHSRLVRSRSALSRLLGALFTGALALQASSAGAQTNVVTCTPSAAVETIVAKLSPAAAIPPANTQYGFKFATTTDGCVANAAKLSSWAPLNGTPNGGLIAKALVALSVKGVGNCGFGLISPNPNAYPATGTLKIKWLDANGESIEGVKATSAFVRLTIVLTPVGFPPVGVLSVTADGVVTKGIGVGANIHTVSTIDDASPISQSWAACVGGVAPAKQIGLKTNPIVTINLQ